MNSKGIELIKKHEGLRLHPYQCAAGKTTIGYGRNIEDNGINEAEADLLLTEDIIRCIKELEIGLPIYRDINDVRQSVLINMCFNMGWPRMSKFKKMIEALNDHYYTRAASEMLDSRWADQVGHRAQELASMMRSGEWL